MHSNVKYTKYRIFLLFLFGCLYDISEYDISELISEFNRLENFFEEKKLTIEDDLRVKLTIGKDITIRNYKTEQKGYGRQGLYLIFNEIEGEYYMNDVFPNIEEYYNIPLDDYSYFDEENNCYRNSNGNGEYERTYSSIDEYLAYRFEGEEIIIDYEEMKVN